jgi:general secretion pathway protein E
MAGKGTKKAAARGKKAGRTTRSAAKRQAPRQAAAASAPADAPARSDELLTMAQAIEKLRTTRPTFYRWLRSGKVKGMKVGRQWRFRPEDIDRFLHGEEPRIELPVGTGSILAGLEQALTKAGVRDRFPEGEPIVRVVNSLILLAMRSRASDIHIQPYAQAGDGPGEALVRLRIDGVLHEALKFDLRLLPAVVERLKRMAACDPLKNRVPQDGRIMMKVHGDTADLRANFAPALFGESVTIRLLHREAIALDLENMPFSERDMRVLRDAIALPCGMIIVAGPTGSGKTTTLYCALKELNTPARKIITIEDPVEYSFPGMVQMQIRPQEGATFEVCMRTAFRSDPDVIMLGEVRSAESLNLCFQAALTGHLVFTQLHTNTATGTLKRMRDIGADAFLIGEATRLVVAQRLIRRLCPHCRKAEQPSARQIEQAIAAASRGGVNWDTLPRQFHKPVGCDKCAKLGYRGRTALVEAMQITDPISAALRRDATEDELRTIAVGQGMTTLAADGVRRAAEGETTLAEVFRVTANL